MVEAPDPPPDPERLLIVARFEDGRYLLVRDGEELPARLPAVRQGGPNDPPGEATRAALELGLGLRVLGAQARQSALGCARLGSAERIQ